MTSTMAAAVVPAPTSSLVLRDVGRQFDGDPPVHALHDVSLEVQEGDYISVMGTSGSGKSTLLNILGLLDTPTSGSYSLRGQEAAGLREKVRTALRGQLIGFVFQSFHLLPRRSALQNVELSLIYSGRPRRDRGRLAEAALREVGLGHRLDAAVATLSGGEKQRVALARALAIRPALLLCDEPTGNLDSSTAASILALIDEAHANGQTVVVVTHDPAVARQARRHVVMSDGMLTEVDV